MKVDIFIIVLISSGLLLLSGLSIARDSYSEAKVPDSVAPPINEDSFENSADIEGYYSDEHCPYDCCETHDTDCSSMKRKFHEQPCYTGVCPKGDCHKDCDKFPKSLCLIYSDHYKWFVHHDYKIDCHPRVVGKSNCRPIELIRGYYRNYYHILKTDLVMSTENPEIFSINAPVSCMNGKCAAP